MAKAFQVNTITEKKPLNTMPPSTFHLNIGPEIRRLAVKMSVGLAALLRPGVKILSEESRCYLLGERPVNVPVRIAYLSYGQLKNLRPPLGHLIFVEADPDNRSAYGVVQLFGTIQLYVMLNDSYSGPRFSLLGSFDTLKGDERFQEITPLTLPVPPQFNTQDAVVRGVNTWKQNLLDEIERAFGTSPLKIRIQDNFSKTTFLPGPTISELTDQNLADLTLPVLLFEATYDLEVRYQLPLTDVAVGVNIDDGDFSINQKDGYDFVQMFIDLWKEKKLDTAPTIWHDMPLPVMQLRVDQEWTSVTVSARYKINRRARLKYFKMKKNTPAELARVQTEISEVIDLNDATWFEIEDEAALKDFYSQETSALHLEIVKNEIPQKSEVRLTIGHQ
jgi:hypothetical protein